MFRIYRLGSEAFLNKCVNFGCMIRSFENHANFTKFTQIKISLDRLACPSVCEKILMGRSKHFIDKNKSQHFYLLSRSQTDEVRVHNLISKMQ